ncbi:MAG: putative Cation-transporting ATPase pma1 [Streblomastix strix]|uniref:Putative Cation-transporting ATPase pma1 n=1 Tax=Streblomastix strix TaxID=222440 RepID=A0A5J4VTW9_9EUKA|nr:MAG: putative Cation-transporting ATPase pma1 [Streblomastix strix]
MKLTNPETDSQLFTSLLEREMENGTVHLWHSMDVNKVARILETSTEGLKSSEAENRLKIYGLNSLPAKKRMNLFLRFILQFNDAFMIACFIMQEIVEGIVIAFVLMINAVIGFIQEFKADKASDALTKLLSMETNVLRDGTRLTIPSQNVCIGDVVFVQSGDKVPADLRLFEVYQFASEESALTGETTASQKTIDPLPEGSVLGDRTNLAFSGSIAAKGTAWGIVVATGINTELGKINTMVQEVKEEQTPLTRQINKFGYVIVVITLVLIGVSLLVVKLINGDKISWGDAILFAATIGVAAIPEGLPAVVSLTLAIGMQRMAQKHALVRSMPAVETMGAVSVICSDKTGTLTTNQMTAQVVFTRNKKFVVVDAGMTPSEGEIRILDSGVDLSLNSAESNEDTQFTFTVTMNEDNELNRKNEKDIEMKEQQQEEQNDTLEENENKMKKRKKYKGNDAQERERQEKNEKMREKRINQRKQNLLEKLKKSKLDNLDLELIEMEKDEQEQALGLGQR